MALKYTNIGPRLTVSRPLTSPVDGHHLASLAPATALKSVYKRLYRLRFLVARTSSQQNAYCNLLRRRFREDLNAKRAKVLQAPALSWPQVMHRLANTHAFVFNATCETGAAESAVNYYADLKKATAPNTEGSVLSTVIRVEQQKPDWVKYDAAYAWVDRVRAFYAEAGVAESKKEINRLTNTRMAPIAGYLQYEQTLMGVNESLQLCL